MGMPANIMLMYVEAPSIMSSGVCIMRKSGRQNITVEIAIRIEKNMLKYAAFITYFRIVLRSLAPNRCDTGIENPEHKPVTKPIIKKFTELVEPTAASACTPIAFPTITVSVTL